MIKYTAREMNCLQCCIAGMFDLELDKVPSVHAWSKQKGYWFDHFYEWSKKELGYVPVAVTDDTLEDIYHIAIYEKDNKVPHCVIAKCDRVVWDPSPTDKAKEIENTAYSIIFIQIGELSVQHACRLSDELWRQQDEQATTGQPRG